MEKPKELRFGWKTFSFFYYPMEKNPPLKNSTTTKGRKRVAWISGEMGKAIDEESITSSPPKSAATRVAPEPDQMAPAWARCHLERQQQQARGFPDEPPLSSMAQSWRRRVFLLTP